VIVYRDTTHAAEVAARQGIRADDLAIAGAVDRVVTETSPHQLLHELGRALQAELGSLAVRDDDSRLASRRRKYRHLGMPPA